jgi:hypothetical protein
MTYILALALVLAAAIVVLALVAIADWQQTHQLVSRGAGPANHRTTVQFGG